MTRRLATGLLTAGAAGVALLAAGCASTTTRSSSPGAAVQSVSSSLDTSLAAGGSTWVAAVMGGSRAENNAFWQLFVRSDTSNTWKLVTPPGVATNGGLVLAGAGSQSVLAGFRPGVDLTFSALATTRDTGASWSPGGPLDPGLVKEPDALAVAPVGEQLVALVAGGKAEESGNSGASWSALTSERSLAASTAGRSCGLTGLTAASYTPSGLPLLGGTCDHIGTAGIFSYSGGQWQAAGPTLPASLTGQRAAVLRLTRTASGSTAAGNVALLVAGVGKGENLVAAWSSGTQSSGTHSSGTHWTVSAPVTVGSAGVRASGFGTDGAAWVILADGRAETISGPGSAWRALPSLPAGTETLAYGAAGALDAMAVGDGKAGAGSELTVLQLASTATAWTREQTINVPIQYGSSG